MNTIKHYVALQCACRYRGHTTIDKNVAMVRPNVTTPNVPPISKHSLSESVKIWLMSYRTAPSHCRNRGSWLGASWHRHALLATRTGRCHAYSTPPCLHRPHHHNNEARLHHQHTTAAPLMLITVCTTPPHQHAALCLASPAHHPRPLCLLACPSHGSYAPHATSL